VTTISVRRHNADLETVTLEGVEILSTGGPIHGVGSPPEGDFWKPEDLRAMADAATELGDELKPPSKIGHGTSSDPAVGWLTNQRVSDDGTKLLADVHDVPRKFADLLNAKAYRTRSVELSKVTSQTTGKVYDWAVTGLAWLGAKMPAVKTLDDVALLYEGGGVEPRLVVEHGGPSADRWAEEHLPTRSSTLYEQIDDATLRAYEEAEMQQVARQLNVRVEDLVR
jgi:hypothetical protein